MAYRLLGYRLGFTLLATLAVAGCFTSPVNMRPTVEIKSPGPVFRGQMRVDYTAIVSDPDNDPWTLTWAVDNGDCPANAKSQEAWPSKWTPTSTFTVGPEYTSSLYCVWAKATDRYGAFAVAVRPETPENHLPEVKLAVEMPAAPAAATVGAQEVFPLHTAFTIVATVTDPDAGDPPTFNWSVAGRHITDVKGGDCSPPARERFCFTADVADEYDVKLDLVDGTDHVMKTLTVSVGSGHAPSAKLVLVSPTGDGPFPLGTSFQLSARDSTDPDVGDAPGLRFAWDFKPATGASTPPDHHCPDDQSESLWCFTGDAPGKYSAIVTVTDSQGNHTSAMKEVVVLEDAMPCLGQTSPPMDAKVVAAKTDEARRFEVFTVIDDLDPFPHPEAFKDAAKFDWFMSTKPGEWSLESNDADIPTFSIDAGRFSAGTEVKVRVQIRDRDTRRSQLAFEQCAGDTCSSGPGCFQRWTWTVRYKL